MKKTLLCLLSFAFLYAEEQTNTEIKKPEDGYLYLNAMTSNNNQIKTLLYPYYIGLGYRLKVGKNAIDLNVNVPVLIVKYYGHNLVNSDLSYIRYYNKDYYLIAGITQEAGKLESLQYYMVSPFLGYGKEFNMFKSKMFAHFKINSLSYFPYLKLNRGYYTDERINKHAFWKLAYFNICAGFYF